MSGRSETIRALDCVVYINGQVFGVASDASWQISTGRKAIFTIDSNVPAEQHATRSTVGGSLQIFRKHGDAGVEGVGVTPVQNQLSSERYFFLQILDATTDNILLEIPKAAIGNQSWQVAARGWLKGSFDFVGLTYNTNF